MIKITYQAELINGVIMEIEANEFTTGNVIKYLLNRAKWDLSWDGIEDRTKVSEVYDDIHDTGIWRNENITMRLFWR